MGSGQVDNWAQIVGILVPFVVALLAKTNWSSQTKAYVSGAVALVLGVISVGLAGGFANGIGWQTWTTQVLAVYGASAAVYALLRQPLKVLEAKTTPAPGRRAA